ncbi:MAG: intradiol ring-cleavage dioxygenase [Acidimicrobiia bacterium]|nr:intradiol ring-cleavage dioxygenase [Acidimicrobiia bacterium]
MSAIIVPGRRAFLGALGLAPFFTTRGLFAETLTPTKPTTEGPFYPDTMPLDTDNDLLVINDSITPAVGEVTWLTGKVVTETGAPVRNAFIEIWQVDAKATYLHTKGRTPQRDANFQGYGRCLTSSSGEYLFRTVKPVPYTLGGVTRAPHIHIAVSRNGKRLFTTQIAIRGHHQNAGDIVFKPLSSADMNTLVADFAPVPGSSHGELNAKFDLVLNRTAVEGDDGVLRGGIGKPEGLRGFRR